jgi:hypothetical protein
MITFRDVVLVVTAQSKIATSQRTIAGVCTVQCTCILDGKTEAEFLAVIGTKVIRVFLLAIHSHFYLCIYSPPPPYAKVG